MFDIDQYLADQTPVLRKEAAPAIAPAPEPEPAFFCAVTTYFQPIVRASDLMPVGYEALARGPQDSPLHPARVLFATAAGLGETERLERVCWTNAILGATRNRLWSYPGEYLFLNLSPERVGDPTFFHFVQRLLADTGIPADRVVLEVTEESRLRTGEDFLRALLRYRDLGFRIALDDVGAGYSDLQALAEIRPDFLKVAMALVRGVDGHHGRRHVVGALVMLGHAMGSQVVVEGVETEAELEAARALGVDCIQGHLIGRPAAGLRLPSLAPSLRAAA